MPTWLLYGLASSLFWGTYAVISKVVTSEKYFKVSSSNASLLMFAGIMLVFLAFFLVKAQNLNMLTKGLGFGLLFIMLTYILFALNEAGLTLTLPLVFFGLLQGILWATGMVFTFLAFSSGAEAAKLVPIYNTNTLIAIFLGIAFLHELPAPDQRFKVITGALLIVVGSILVSR